MLALPIVIAGEWAGEKILHNPLSDTVDRVTRHRRFSWLRILYYLALALVLIVVGMGIASLWRH
jgi:hypothetical protein